MKQFSICTCTLLVLALGACKKETEKNTDRPLGAATIILPAGDTLPQVIEPGDTLRLNGCGNTYYLSGKCYVKNGGVLQIGAGVTIVGINSPFPAQAAALVVTRGGKINAQGTATGPVTFTSTTNTPGSWGGIILLGRAPVNKNNLVIEGLPQSALPPGVDAQFGGTNAADNSGVLSYAKILNAGAALGPDNELNGLTLGGVGSGTTIHHLYFANGADDAIQAFGGTVGLRYIISESADDDFLNFDYGYRGNVQFGLSFNKTPSLASNSHSNGIESQNDATGTFDVPQTRPVISNITIIGGNCTAITGTQYGSYWRWNTGGMLYNSVIMGYNYGAFVNNSPAAVIKNNVLHGFIAGSNLPGGSGSPNIEIAGGCANAGVRLNNPFGTLAASFDPRPSPSSPAACCANFAELAPYNFFITSYRGAFNPAATTRLDWAAFALDNTPCN
jgi:hypothetical protein